jgi:hypothetical protein
MLLATQILIDVASAFMSNGRMGITVLTYHFRSITTQLIQFNKFELFLVIVIKTAVSPL